jgi:protein-S-isoprenylcysteine O-methyltransferase Ste14
MVFPYRYLIPALWLGWVACWCAMSLRVKPTLRQESPGSRLMHMVPLALSVWLLWQPGRMWPWLGMRILPRSAVLFWTSVALTLAGLLFCVWARVYLGRNWSGTVTLKEDHELVTGGPYRLVRHPIYTGLLLAVVGSAAARGNLAAAAAIVLTAAALWRKLRMEESWMREQFGAHYQSYSRRVAALIPFVL